MLSDLEVWRRRFATRDPFSGFWLDLFHDARDLDAFAGVAGGLATLVGYDSKIDPVEAVMALAPVAALVNRRGKKIAKRTREGLAFTFGEAWRRGIP